MCLWGGGGVVKEGGGGEETDGRGRRGRSGGREG